MNLLRRLAVCSVLASAATAAQAQPLSITGTATLEATGEELVGAILGLFADDNGDNIFDANVDKLIDLQITDLNGQYEFSGLDASTKYFVQQAEQSVNGIPLTSSISPLLELASFNTLIDDFKDQQEVKVHPRASLGVTNLTTGGAIGGQRDLHIEYKLGSAEASLYSNPFGMSNVLEFDQSAGVIAVATITWDGMDADLSTTPAIGGLGGIDITENGSEAFAFNFGIDAAGAGENLTMRIFSGSNVATASVPLPVTDGTASVMHIIPFSAFVGDADLTAVDAIQLEFGGNNPSIDAQIGPIGSIGKTTHNISAIAIPEPSGCLMGLIALACVAGARRKRRL